MLEGVGIPLEGRRRSVRGRKGGLRGYYVGTGRRPLWRVRAGIGAFRHKHLRRKQTKAWNEREAAHAWKMGQRREGDSSGT